MHHLSKFAFYEELKPVLKRWRNHRRSLQKNNTTKLFLFVYPLGLNYGNLPKALLSFHRYAENTAQH